MSDWSSYVCSSDLRADGGAGRAGGQGGLRLHGLSRRLAGPADGRARLRGAAAARRGHRLRGDDPAGAGLRGAEVLSCRVKSEEHTSELQSLMRISYAVFCLKKKQQNKKNTT